MKASEIESETQMMTSVTKGCGALIRAPMTTIAAAFQLLDAARIETSIVLVCLSIVCLLFVLCRGRGGGVPKENLFSF